MPFSTTLHVFSVPVPMNYYTDPEIIHTDPNPAPEYLYSDPRKKIKSQFFPLKLSFSINQIFLKNLPLYRVYVLDPDSYLSVRIRIRLLLYISGSASLNYFLLWNETLLCRVQAFATTWASLAATTGRAATTRTRATTSCLP